MFWGVTFAIVGTVWANLQQPLRDYSSWSYLSGLSQADFCLHAIHAPILAFERSLFDKKRVHMGKVIWEYYNPRTGSWGVCKMIGKNLVVRDQNKKSLSFCLFLFWHGIFVCDFDGFELVSLLCLSSEFWDERCGQLSLAAVRGKGWRSLPLFSCFPVACALRGVCTCPATGHWFFGPHLWVWRKVKLTCDFFCVWCWGWNPRLYTG